METRSSDVTIIGAGIAGLWSAKELSDRGVSVTIIEKSSTLADGATTRNEGWLHAGTYHAQAIEDEADAMQVTARTLYGHDEIVRFAPDCIDHIQSYTFSADSSRTERIVDRWQSAGVEFTEVPVEGLAADGVETNRFKEAFRVKDKSVDSNKLCRKLAEHIASRGGTFITGAEVNPTSDTEAEVRTPEGVQLIRSDRFLITAGSGINDFVEKLTGSRLMMRYFQAHLLVLPRITRDNYFFLDVGEAGIMNHGDTSIIGINRDGLELSNPSFIVDPRKISMIRNALVRLIPSASQYSPDDSRILPVACCKPDIFSSSSDTQSLDIQILEPSTNYVVAMPGKMTEAPYLAKEAVRYVLGETRYSAEKVNTSGIENIMSIPDVTLRPADRHVAALKSAADAQPLTA